MTINSTIAVSFDPVKEYKAMLTFEKNNPDCIKYESTFSITYVKEQIILYEVKE